jgi:hypothetical protein
MLLVLENLYFFGETYEIQAYFMWPNANFIGVTESGL